MMDTDFLSPLLLASDLFTIGTADGAQATPDAKRFINPNRSAMLIDEFRITHGEMDVKNWTQIYCRLTYGSTPLTNGFIPVRSFMPVYFQFDAPSGSTDAGSGPDTTLTWHLPRPLYVPPDVPIGVEFLRKFPTGGSATAGGVTPWSFVVAGRSMPGGMEVPKKIFVPWACATTVAQTVSAPFISGDADIGNPFDTPLHMDYFTGYNVRADGPNFFDMTFQATLSNGKVLARDPTPFTLLFPPDRPVLRMRALLQPKEFISVVLDLPPWANGAENTLVFSTVGMTGWREMNTPLGALP